MASIIRSRWFAVLTPSVVGLLASYLCVEVAGNYGLVLFIGLPLVVSFLSSFCFCFGRECGFGATFLVAALSIIVLGMLILCFALDGLICLLMALPLALALALPAVALGRLAGRAARGNRSSIVPLMLVLLFPCLVAFEESRPPVAPLRAVTTSVAIHAPVRTVWNTVIAFPRIQCPPAGIFKMGIAYPIEARIEGSGVGAIRYCTFSTGSFVEPITTWTEDRLLAFDVSSSPPPMEEFSLYQHVDPPHLHGHLVSKKGQFLLRPSGDGVILEGTTWYRHEMWPQWYWAPLSDQIIHNIHHRVLDHIKTIVESPSR